MSALEVSPPPGQAALAPSSASVLNCGLVGLLVDIKTYAQVPPPRTCQCNLIWKKCLHRCN